MADDGLDQHEREREDVTPRPGRAVAPAELFRRAVTCRERLQRGARLFEGLREALRFADDLGDAEVEHFQRFAPAYLGQEQIGRFDVAMRNALLVRERQRARGAI